MPTKKQDPNAPRVYWLAPSVKPGDEIHVGDPRNPRVPKAVRVEKGQREIVMTPQQAEYYLAAGMVLDKDPAAAQAKAAEKVEGKPEPMAEAPPTEPKESSTRGHRRER